MILSTKAGVKVLIRTEDINKSNVIYKLTFPNGKLYIGLTADILKKRLQQHVAGSFSKKASHLPKSRAIRKYLEFSVDVLYQGEDLNEKEIEYIELFDSTKNDKGYNVCLGGGSMSGFKHSEETKRKLSDSKKGSIPWNKGVTGIKITNTENMKGRTPWNKGKKDCYTNEQLKRISEANRKKALNGCKIVNQIDDNGNIVNVFESVKQAGEILDIKPSGISEVCCGRMKTYKGFRFKYND